MSRNVEADTEVLGQIRRRARACRQPELPSSGSVRAGPRSRRALLQKKDKPENHACDLIDYVL